jgi:hypothetical protein
MNRVSISVTGGGDGCKTIIAFGVNKFIDRLSIETAWIPGCNQRSIPCSQNGLETSHGY